MVFFYQHLFIPNMSFIFLSLFIQHSKIFFLKKTNKTHFFNFSFFFKIKHHPISIKKHNENPFFVFSQKFKHIFLQVRIKFFESQRRRKIYWYTKRKTFFYSFSIILFFFTENRNTCVSALLSTCKRNMRTEVSLHVS